MSHEDTRSDHLYEKVGFLDAPGSCVSDVHDGGGYQMRVDNTIAYLKTCRAY